MTFTTDIIPKRANFIGTTEDLDYEAICVFIALGFFLDQDTFYKKQRVLKPATHYEFDKKQNKIISQKPYFKWFYAPIERSFATITEEFGDLFESIIATQTKNKKVILPLSGGLDSRTQAVALKRLNSSVHSYSYSFQGGHDESWYGKQIAKVCDFSFQALKIPRGYLWDKIEQLAAINDCYSEFTHPRQMAFIDSYEKMGDVFSLGHWGDVLFDDMGVSDDLSLDDQAIYIYKKVVKKQGLLLAETLWEAWGLHGDFKTYLMGRLYNLLKAIDISNSANARIRAFKSLYWAPRWTSVNLSIFESVRPISLPYYHPQLCEFICQVPESYLSKRQIQIAYIKQRMPELAKVPWQAHKPFNLYSFSYDKLPWNLPYRVLSKLQRSINTQPFIQRNWELQFLGKKNEEHLRSWLFDTPHASRLIPDTILAKTYELFKNSDGLHESHAVSMLLTLSVFANREKL